MSIDALEKKRKQLIFRSWHRGTKEMDLIMGGFADAHVADFDAEQVAQYEAIMQENDPDLYNWLTRKEDTPANIQSDIFQMLLNHVGQ